MTIDPQVETKPCNFCGVTKMLVDFAKDKRLPAGYSGQCLDCRSAHHRVRRQDPIYKERNALRARRNYQRNPEAAKARRRAEHKAKPNMQKHDPFKFAAQLAVRNAVQSGRLVKPELCAECGKPGRIHGHHEDYSRQLDVVWLCHPCHMAKHRRYPSDVPTLRQEGSP